jgi:hypothetical protein
MLFVDVFGVLPDCIGLMGYAGKPYGLFARDGKTDLTGEWNSFGEEWQVQDDDPIFSFSVRSFVGIMILMSNKPI